MSVRGQKFTAYIEMKSFPDICRFCVAWWLNSFRLLLFVLSLIGEKQGINRNWFSKIWKKFVRNFSATRVVKGGFGVSTLTSIWSLFVINIPYPHLSISWSASIFRFNEFRHTFYHYGPLQRRGWKPCLVCWATTAPDLSSIRTSPTVYKLGAAEKTGGYMEAVTAKSKLEPPDPQEESRCKVTLFEKVG